MTIKLVNYTRHHVRFDIGEDFIKIDVYVISGDEVAEVLYKDGRGLKFDSCPEGIHRTEEYRDAFYTLFDKERGIDHLHNEEWLTRDDGEDFALYLLLTDLDKKENENDY